MLDHPLISVTGNKLLLKLSMNTGLSICDGFAYQHPISEPADDSVTPMVTTPQAIQKIFNERTSEVGLLYFVDIVDDFLPNRPFRIGNCNEILTPLDDWVIADVRLGDIWGKGYSLEKALVRATFNLSKYAGSSDLLEVYCWDDGWVRHSRIEGV